MASKLILKKSSVPAKVPVAGDLEYGELAINYADGKLFYKTAGNTIAEISGAGGGGGGSSTLTVDTFTGTGSQTAFTLSATPVGVNYTLVVVDGVTQRKTVSYTVSGTTLTFLEAPANGAAIEVTTYSVTIAGVANQLSTARTVSLTGDVTYTSGGFDGTSNVTGTATLANTTVSPGTYNNANITVDAKGRITSASTGTQDITTPINTAITTHEAAVDPHPQYQTSTETLVTVATATGDIHGIVDRTASTLSFNETTREFSIAPVSGSWTYYHTGTLYTVSTTKTLTVSTTDGAKFVYIDAAGNLNEHSIPDFATNVYLCYIYWNNAAGRAAIFGDERHGAKRDTTWHSAQHQNVGTVWRSGGDLTYTLNSDATVQIGIGTPVNIADEDLLHSITHSASPTNNFEQILTTAASLEVIYLSGSSYTTTTTNTLPWIHSSNVAQYNSIVANSGSLASVTEGKYITYWMVATNDLRAGRGAVKLVLGRQLNDTVDEAYSESFTEYGLSFAEQVFMYQIVVQYSSAYTGNAARIRLSGIRKILAKLATTSVAAAPATSHSVLTGRSDADAHPIAAITNLQTTLDGKQATLVSGTNIKTVNSTSLLGSGNVAVQETLVSGTNIKTINGTTILGSGNISTATLLAESTSVFTTGSAQTYTAPANTQWVKITVVGPGGNGGGANNQRATGGGGGAVAVKWLAINPGQTLTYTVGTTSGTASTVSSGTLTITTISAGSGANGAGTAYANSSTAGAAGGTATGGDLNITGGQGGHSYGSSTTVATNFSGKGGDCPGFGSGGTALGAVATAGVQGNGFGAGGGGAHGSNTTAAGRGGVIIFEAY